MTALMCVTVRAQSAQNPHGVEHSIAAEVPNPGMSYVRSNTDGTVTTYAPDYYRYYAATNASMVNAQFLYSVNIADATTNNCVPCPKFVQPYSTTLFYAVKSSNSVSGMLTGFSPSVSITTPPAPIVYTQPLAPPSKIWPQ